MEPSQPVDPPGGQSPGIPPARRGGAGPQPEHEFGPLPEPEQPGDVPGDRQAPPAGGAERAGDPADAASADTTGAVPASADTTGAAPAGADAPDGAGDTGEQALPSVWNARTITVIVLGVLMVLCSGGLVTGYFVYQRAAEPDRSNPGAVVTRYVEATFNTRSTTEAKRYTCANPGAIGESGSLLAEIENKERSFNVRIDVTIGDMDTRTSGNSSTVAAQLRLKTVVSGRFQEQIQYWEFALKHRSGWRVCGAHRTG